MAYTTIDDPSAYFQTKIYAGDNASNLVLTFDGNSDLQPDFLWQKQRGGATDHNLSNSVIGADQGLSSNTNEEEQDNGTGYIKSFQSNGFTVGNSDKVNASSSTNVAWAWKEQAGVFDIVSYTGNGSNRTISHSLGSVPKMMIVKRRDASASWFVYHVANGNGNVMKLDNTEAVSAYAEYWNSTTPTSSVFSLGTAATANVNNGTFIAYLFGNKQGVSKCGSYTGNANANGTFVHLGFKPAFVMVKQTNTGDEPWVIKDSKRSPINTHADSATLFASVNSAESNRDAMSFLSNGFKCRDNGAPINSGSYIYLAFAEQPFVTSKGIPATAR